VKRLGMKNSGMVFSILAAALLLATPAVVRADCPYDHVKVGQQGGQLVLDFWQLYRHCQVDYKNPYGMDYYQWADAGIFYTRAEPGFALSTEPAIALPGTPLTDYHLMIERVSASSDLEFLNDNWQNILVNDGDMISLSSVAEQHLHMRYVVYDNPDEARWVTYRLVDSLGTYQASEPFTVYFGAVPEPATVSLLGAGLTTLLIRRMRRRSE